MKKFIYNEMIVHVPLCTHKDPKNILIISDEAQSLEKEVEKHSGISSQSIKCSLDEISKIQNSYDVVISDTELDELFLSQVNRILKEDGLLVTKHPELDKVDENKSVISSLSNYFKIIMPYNVGDGSTLLLSSKSYHPTADLILQRADMLDNLDHYNCDIHPAAFAMGNNIRKAYLGVLKN